MTRIPRVAVANHERRPEVSPATETRPNRFPGSSPVKVVQHDAADGGGRGAVEQEPRLEVDLASVRGVLAAQLGPLVVELAKLARIRHPVCLGRNDEQ